MRKSKKFWDREYKKPAHLALSTEPSSDLEKFTRWFARRGYASNSSSLVLDLGCGNGRNLIWLAREFGVKGIGYDISAEAVAQAGRSAKSDFALTRPASGKVRPKSDFASLQFSVRALNEPLPQADASVDLVLDMMASHVLRAAERAKFRDEIWRVLKPNGWLFFKSFLLDEDLHARRLLREHPTDEPNSYIHPTFNHFEHVWTIDELEDFFGAQFEIHKIEKSHKHLSHGKAFRRRTVTVYLQKRD